MINPIRELTFFLKIHAERTNSRFPKSFPGGHVFVVVEYLCNRSSKIRIKIFKNFISILTIVNYRNWLDASAALKRLNIALLILQRTYAKSSFFDDTKLRNAKLPMVRSQTE